MSSSNGAMDDQDNDSGCLCGGCFRNCVGWNSNINLVMVLTARWQFCGGVLLVQQTERDAVVVTPRTIRE